MRAGDDLRASHHHTARVLHGAPCWESRYSVTCHGFLTTGEPTGHRRSKKLLKTDDKNSTMTDLSHRQSPRAPLPTRARIPRDPPGYVVSVGFCLTKAFSPKTQQVTRSLCMSVRSGSVTSALAAGAALSTNIYINHNHSTATTTFVISGLPAF